MHSRQFVCWRANQSYKGDVMGARAVASVAAGLVLVLTLASCAGGAQRTPKPRESLVFPQELKEMVAESVLADVRATFAAGLAGEKFDESMIQSMMEALDDNCADPRAHAIECLDVLCRALRRRGLDEAALRISGLEPLSWGDLARTGAVDEQGCQNSDPWDRLRIPLLTVSTIGAVKAGEDKSVDTGWRVLAVTYIKGGPGAWEVVRTQVLIVFMPIGK